MSRDLDAEEYHANVMAWAHVPQGALAIYCTKCKGERPARKLYGPAPGRLHGLCWYNVCCSCHTHFVSLPPAAQVVRHRRRMYEKRSKQLLLGGASK